MFGDLAYDKIKEKFLAYILIQRFLLLSQQMNFGYLEHKIYLQQFTLLIPNGFYIYYDYNMFRRPIYNEKFSCSFRNGTRRLKTINLVHSVLHDNANSFKVTVRLLTDIEYSVNCAAHTLQLCLKDALNSVLKYCIVYNKASKIFVSHFKYSNVATSALGKNRFSLA